VQHAVLIAITGCADEACRCRAQEIGFDHYLVKPVEPEYLHKLIRRVVGPLRFTGAATTDSDGMPNGRPPWRKWLSAEIPASGKRPTGGTHSLVGSS
jgi:DNA-binding NarL/FixJ family response regulator